MKIQMKALTYMTKQKARIMKRITERGKRGEKYEEEEKIIEQLENELVTLKLTSFITINKISPSYLIYSGCALIMWFYMWFQVGHENAKDGE